MVTLPSVADNASPSELLTHDTLSPFTSMRHFQSLHSHDGFL